ncbi:MAG: hypothetical protein CMN32_10915 [Saprospirales bacterium]|nr:hypothetical protein [Saprospirales bacterium]
MARWRVNWAKRKQDLQDLAYRHEMTFYEKDEWGMNALLKDFSLFSIGHSRKVFNILYSATDFLEEKLAVFDYRYTIQAGNTPVTHLQTVFFIQSKQLSLPQMLLKPENFFHKIGTWFGMQDIDFEEYPEFSDRYLLQGEDEQRIRKTIDENVSRFFLVQKKWSMESVGYFLALYKHQHLMEAHELDHFLKKGQELYGYLKSKDDI